jgi:mannitol/fructose-specific phosphotransferase system IIA component
MNLFGFKKKETKPDLLKKENIRMNCKRAPKDEVILEVGKMLYECGYVDANYPPAMLKREETFSTIIGNGIALPHGVEEAKKAVIHSGIAVMAFPEGTNWGEEDVKLVVGVAGVGEEHLRILGIVADKMLDPDAADKIANADAENVYKILSGEE